MDLIIDSFKKVKFPSISMKNNLFKLVMKYGNVLEKQDFTSFSEITAKFNEFSIYFDSYNKDLNSNASNLEINLLKSLENLDAELIKKMILMTNENLKPIAEDSQSKFPIPQELLDLPEFEFKETEILNEVEIEEEEEVQEQEPPTKENNAFLLRNEKLSNQEATEEEEEKEENEVKEKEREIFNTKPDKNKEFQVLAEED